MSLWQLVQSRTYRTDIIHVWSWYLRISKDIPGGIFLYQFQNNVFDGPKLILLYAEYIHYLMCHDFLLYSFRLVCWFLYCINRYHMEDNIAVVCRGIYVQSCQIFTGTFVYVHLLSENSSSVDLLPRKGLCYLLSLKDIQYCIVHYINIQSSVMGLELKKNSM